MKKPKVPDVLKVIPAGRNPDGAHQFVVVNESKNSARLVVWLGPAGVCPCEAYGFHHACKHERAAAEHVKINGLAA